MQLLYKSTRDSSVRVTASEAILKGLAPDGGLYVPEFIPRYEGSLDELSRLDYRETAMRVMSLLLTDFSQEELRTCVDSAYDDKFDTEKIALVRKADSFNYLELFHGATIAFKDMALSILPHLMTVAARKNKISDEVVILTATSGDTGKAAMAGFSDVPGTRIAVFYPKGGVSLIQERQMLTQKGSNVHVVGIRGNFDDAQTGVKKIFRDPAMISRLSGKGMRFSSANSINIGRLVPQIVYYFYAYGQMLASSEIKAGDKINITVPTGNFGNILAAYYAKNMGLPVNKLICASNENKVLFDFFRTGSYDRRRDFILTSSPSMDILISSNLERLIYRICSEDSEVTKGLMEELSSKGSYKISPEMEKGLADFYGNYASVEETSAEIASLFKKSGYLIDTHTAVASCVARKYRTETADMTPMLIASTASPYKFLRSVVCAVDPSMDELGDFELIDKLRDLSGVPVPAAIEDIRTAPIIHDTQVDINEMEDEVARWLKL